LTIMSPFVKVISNEGETFEVDIKAIKMSQTVKTMFEALGVDENRNDLEPIPFPLVDSATLKKIIAYCEHHKNDARPNFQRKGCISNWDFEFLANEPRMLISIIMAADYLEIQSLRKIAGIFVHHQITGKPLKRI
ncbi:S-phase kinase-associated protein 1, partial [Trichinella pseudospiralis]